MWLIETIGNDGDTTNRSSLTGKNIKEIINKLKELTSDVTLYYEKQASRSTCYMIYSTSQDLTLRATKYN